MTLKRVLFAVAACLVCTGCQLPPDYVAHLNGGPAPAPHAALHAEPTFR